MTQRKRVLIVEDDELTGARLSDAIKECNYSLAGLFTTLKQAKAGLQKAKPDVLLIDLGLPDGSGIELIRLANNLFAELRIMVISVFADERHVIDAIEAGAHGYLLKDGDVSQIKDSIEQLINGGSPITPSVAIYLLKRFQGTESLNDKKSSSLSLTNREQDVLKLIARGLNYAEISINLQLSVNTIRVHMKNLFRKLAVTSRSEAVFEAVEKGILRM